jgi:hypothetical protein
MIDAPADLPAIEGLELVVETLLRLGSTPGTGSSGTLLVRRIE